MKWKLFLVIGIFIFLSSCKDKAAGDTTNTDTLTTNTTTTTNEGMNGSVTGTVDVPMGVKTTFEEKYPQASGVRWDYYRPVEPSYINWDWTGWPRIDTTDYMVNYNWQGNDYMSWYDNEGTWVGTVSTINDYTSLPAAVNTTLSSQYNGYTITSAKKENDKNRTAYEIHIEKDANSGNLLIAENGKILKKKMMMGDTKTKEKMNPKDSAQ